MEKVNGYWGCEKSDGNWDILKFENQLMSDYRYRGHVWMLDASVERVEKSKNNSYKVIASYEDYDGDETEKPKTKNIEYFIKSNDDFKRSLTVYGKNIQNDYTYIGSTQEEVDSYITAFSGNSANEETIEGYWMAESGETISFNSNSKAIIDGVAMDYSIYGQNNLSISFLGIASEYRYIINNDVLKLQDLNKGSTSVYYRNESVQQEIIKKLNSEKAEREKKEQIDKEKQEFEKYINNLKHNIELNNNEISEKKKRIEDYKKEINEYNKNINDENAEIKKIENEIAQLQQNTSETTEDDILVLKDSQTFHLDNINFYNEQIKYYSDLIKECEEKITNLESENAQNTSKLKELGRL